MRLVPLVGVVFTCVVGRFVVKVTVLHLSRVLRPGHYIEFT